MQDRTVQFVESCGSLKGGKPMPRAVAAMITMIVLAISGFTPCAHAQIPCSYEVSAIIQAPPCGIQARTTYATAISPNGRWVVGFYCQCLCIEYESFVYDTLSGTFATIPRPANVFTSRANDVNDTGIVVGFMGGSAGNFGYVYDATAGQYLQLLTSDGPGGMCEATGINNSNIVCGTRSIGSTTDPINPQTAFRWSAVDGFTDLGLINDESTACTDINDAGVSVGGMTQHSMGVAFAWNGRKLSALPTLAGLNTFAVEIKNDGTVVGAGYVSIGSPSIFHAYKLRNGVMTGLPPLPGFNRSSGSDITSAETVLGWSAQSGGGPVAATIWIGDQPFRLDERLVNSTIALSHAIAASVDGRILARAESESVVAVVLDPLQPAGDVNGDCVVNVTDLLRVIGDWGSRDSPSDLNEDGIVNVHDLVIVILHWGT